MPDRTDPTSKVNQFLRTIHMHLANFEVTFAVLEAKRQISIGCSEGEIQGVRTSMVAKVMTEFNVPSCMASNGFSTFRRSKATESAIKISEV